MSDELRRQTQEFLGDGPCLLVEPSAAFSANLQSCLGDLGVPLNQIVVIRKFEEAKLFITDKKPRLILSEYDITGGSGLALLELQESQYEERRKIAVVVTKNSSASAVAESAEGSVDAFILKPFSAEVFRKKMAEVLSRKLHPTRYTLKIQEGRGELAVKNFAEALQGFTEAKSLNEQPTLAHYYAGAVHQSQGDIDKALAEFRRGRQYQPIHYKCLMGEFEGLMAQQKYKDAYALVPLIKANYPITSHRLGQIFIAAVFTYHFDDLEDYYDLFLSMENRSAWLIELTSLALFTAGKYWAKKDPPKALSYFDMGMTVRGREISFVESVVDELIRAGAYKEADAACAKILPTDIGSPKHSQLRFKLDYHTVPHDRLIDKGRKLVTDGHANPEIYRLLVTLMSTQGKTTLAESVIAQALREHPTLRKELYEILAAGAKGT